jgi:hypothetical protein
MKMRLGVAPINCSTKAVREAAGLSDAEPWAEIVSDLGVVVLKVGKAPIQIVEQINQQKEMHILLTPEMVYYLNAKPGDIIEVGPSDLKEVFP